MTKTRNSGNKQANTQPDIDEPPSLKPRQPLWILPLGIFTIVSLLPANALAFESSLSTSLAPKLVAPVQVYHESEEASALTSINYSYLMSSVVSASAPGRSINNRPRPTRVAISSPVVAPKTGEPVLLEGEASFYSRAGCLGCNPLRIMANGQPLRDEALTMAIGANNKHLVGHTAKVTNLVNGKSVDVLITDTGGFHAAKYGNRVADLTIGTKQAIGMAGGVGQVRVEVY